uniref:LOW QUALITY PROTEIN: uncharacterized protein LOC108046697 n=1 Tax=Drosophila rhopaloa TaxID=1041015 RepID=A0A6P4F3W7_DRORH
MRFRTAITIGHAEPPRNRGLMELNDDCLLMICEQLSLGDQLRLMELQEVRLCDLVLRLWNSRYAQQFDFRREPQLKLLKPDEQAQLLDHLGRRTKALINLPGTGEGCRKWLKRKRHGLTHLARLTFTKSDSFVQIRLRGNCRIVGLRLECPLDDRLPVVGVSAVEDIFRLQYFAWHSQLTVHYDVADGSVKWMPQRPQAVRSLLRFLAAQATSLRELDFTRNAHATPTFLAQLDAHLKRAGGCGCPSYSHSHSPAPSHHNSNSPSSQLTIMDTDTDTAETNDLAFVELELLHLPNEQTEASTRDDSDEGLVLQDNGWRIRSDC